MRSQGLWPRRSFWNYHAIRYNSNKHTVASGPSNKKHHPPSFKEVSNVMDASCLAIFLSTLTCLFPRFSCFYPMFRCSKKPTF